MDYANIIKELETASSFEIFRLWIALSQELKSGDRVEEIKSKLTVGNTISWFNIEKNCLEEAEILKCNKTKVLVNNFSDDLKWNVEYCAINIQKIDVAIAMDKKVGLKKYELSIGDIVSFKDNFNKLLYGKITKLNPKTARVDTSEGAWKVYYENLQRADDLEAELVAKKIFLSE